MKQKIKNLISLKITSTFLGLLFFVALAGGMAINAPSASAAASTITSATLDYNDGTLVITGTDFVAIVDVTKFHLNDATTVDDVSLSAGSGCVVTNITTITCTLTEAQRIATLVLSGETGGNGGAVVLDVDAGAVEDSGGIDNIEDDANVVTETADTTKPTVTSATLNYSTGVLVVTLSETVDASATDATKFHLNNATGTDDVTLSVAPTDTDATTLTFTLTEAQRVAAIAISGTTGGDGGAVVLDVDALGVTDMATATNLIDDANVVTETADTTKPTVTSATLNYSTGVLVVTLSETVDASATDATKFHLNNATGTDDVTLSVAPTDTDATTLTFTLTEAQRVAAIAISGTTGGDGGAVVLDVDALGVTDMATATNLIDDANVVTETADSVAPTNQDTVFATDVSTIIGESVAIVSSGDITNNVWFAPSGTTSFSAGTTMTTAGGTATTILAPAVAGSYKLFVVDGASNVSAASSATLTATNAGSVPPSSPVPISITGQAVATPAHGGVISKINTDGTSVKVVLPVGALIANAVITINPMAKAEAVLSRPIPAGNSIVGDYAYNFTAVSGLNIAVNAFEKALTLTFIYTNEQVEGINEGALKIHYWDDALNEWVALADSEVDTVNNAVIATTTHFTYFAVFEGESSEIMDGDIIQCQNSDNPFAVYIVKVVGDTKYIRHIVSLEIFNYYTHLKWENLKQVDSLDNYSLSGWARVNTGSNGTPGPTDKVYEINSDQSKHWINMTAEQFLQHGGSDAAIYSVNQGEMNLYTTGPDVMSL